MKLTILILAILVLVISDNAQQQSEYFMVKPVAYERLFWMSPPHKPTQVLIVEVQNANHDLYQVVYFPATDGRRGGTTEFLTTDALKERVLWKFKLHNPTEKERFFCRNSNLFERESKKRSDSEEEESPLRFRSTQMDASIKFYSLSKMPCMILTTPPERSA